MNLKSGLSIFYHDVINLFRGGRVLGIDIGTVAIKAAELTRQSGEIILSGYGVLGTKGYLERGNEAIQTSSLKLEERDIIRLLQIFLKEMKPKTKIVFASIPSFAGFTTILEMPFFSPEETAKAVNFQARQYIPLPISEVTIEWIRTEEFDNEKGQRFQRVLITAIPNELILKYKKIFNAADLTLMAIEMEAHALVRALIKSETPPTLIFDIGAESSQFIVAENGILKYTGQSDYAGVSLTQSVARSLGISAFRAEELKCRRGLLGHGGEYELSTALLPFLDVIIQEGGRVRADYERIYGRKIERFLLAGQTANLPGIGKYFAEQLALIESQPLLFTDIKYPAELEPVVRDLSRTLPIAVGLALKGFS